MARSSGTLEHGTVYFHGELYRDAFLKYPNSKVQLIAENFTPDSGPQLPGENYLSGSNWLFSDDAGHTHKSAGSFVNFVGSPGNAAQGLLNGIGKTTGAIVLGGHIDGNYLTSGYQYPSGKYTATFGLIDGLAFIFNIGTFRESTDTVDFQYSTDNATWTNLNTSGNRFIKSTTGILGPYNSLSTDSATGDILDDARIIHFKLSFTLASPSYLRWKVNPAALVDAADRTCMVGLCETIIQESGNTVGDKDYGDNYSHIQISSKFVEAGKIRIFASAPFWGKVRWSATST